MAIGIQSNLLKLPGIQDCRNCPYQKLSHWFQWYQAAKKRDETVRLTSLSNHSIALFTCVFAGRFTSTETSPIF